MGNTVLAYSGTKVNARYIGAYTRYGYNKDRITSGQLDGEKSESEDKALYEFYADGKLKAIIMPLSDGTELKSEYEYNGYGELVTLTNSKGGNIIEKYEYTYDLNGNTLLSKITRGETVRNIRYTYDKKNRIIGCEDDSGLICGYSYDSMGNRKTELSGNDLLGSKSAAYRYDTADRMYYAKTGDDTTVFDYNSTGLRYLKRENGNDTYYVYDKSGRLALEAKIVSVTSDTEQQIIISPTSYYIWGSDRIIAKVDILTNKRYYYIYNGHGDVTALIDEDGEVANRYDYDVWGNFTQKEETVENPFTYFGQTYDETTGLFYLRARYYDPTTGRFTQQDPAKDSYNWYVYGNNNPVWFVDENGELAYPGQIHNLVVNKVAGLYGLNKEQTITYDIGWGRADLISNEGSVWDVKRDKPRQIAAGVRQVQKYTNNTWKNRPDVDLFVGGEIASGEFSTQINIDMYYVTYRYAGNGVIAYDYYKVCNFDTVKSYALEKSISIYMAISILKNLGKLQLQLQTQ